MATAEAGAAGALVRFISFQEHTHTCSAAYPPRHLYSYTSLPPPPTNLPHVASTQVVSMTKTFEDAVAFNANFIGWSTVKLQKVQQMLKGATSFTGQGAASFNVAQVTNFDNAFTGASGLTSCNKKRIGDAWKSNAVFKASDFGWINDRCEMM